MINKTESLPAGLEEFIHTNFETLTQVEVLCYIYKQTGSQFTSEAICHHLFLSETLTNKTIERLVRKGFIVLEGNSYKLSDSFLQDSGHLPGLCHLFETRKPLIVEILFNSFIKDKE